jgi:putative ABC transport system permease protein
MSFALKHAWRELQNNRAFCFFYLVNLSLGLLGFITIDSFKRSVKEQVSMESQKLLGADLALRTRREFTDLELKQAEALLPEGTKSVDAVDFFSMVAGPTNRSRLVKVVAMAPGFPFHGEFNLSIKGRVKDFNNLLLHEKPIAWIYPELRSQLALDLGDQITLGKTKFRISDIVNEDAGLQFQPAEFAPKVFISNNFIKETELLQEGNTAFRNRLFSLPEGVNPQSLAEKIGQVLAKPDIRVYSHQRAGHRAGRLLRYLSDFLALVSLVALFLACLGSGYLFHGFITRKIKDIAILISLGSTHRLALFTYLLQISILGALAVLPPVLLCFVGLPLAGNLLEEFLPFNVDAGLTLPSILLTFIVAILSGFFLALPSLQKIRKLRPTELFRESMHPEKNSSLNSLMWLAPGLFGFWILCITQADSWKLGNLFFLTFAVCGIVVFILGSLSLAGIDRLFRRSPLPLRLASRSISRNRTSSITSLLALALGVLLLNLIPQFQYSLESEIDLKDSESKLPQLFLFDIQEEHVQSLIQTLEFQGRPLSNLTPWIRGRLLAVKGTPFESISGLDREFDNPDEQRRNAFRNRSFNLSYRGELRESEEIIRGRMVSTTYDANSSAAAEISVEHKYAESLGIDLGDQITIEVSGVQVLAEVVNIRRVRWTSFQPNFFVQMQPGVLETAPKTFIATIEKLSKEEKQIIQDLLVQKFPTISILDVERTGRKILQVVSQMTWALQVMAVLSILVGLIILHTISREKARRQRQEINLQKILGASFTDLRNIVRLEFGALGFFSAFLGVSLSSAASFFLSQFIFDRVWSFHWQLPVTMVIAVTILSSVTAELSTRKVLKEKPLGLLRGD